MEHPKLSARKLRSIQKHFEEKARRGAGQGTPEARGKPTGKRGADWDEQDEAPDLFEKFERRPRPLPPAPDTSTLPTATVVEARRRDYLVALDGELCTARLAPRLVLAGMDSPIVAGDDVRVAEIGDGLLRIDAVEPRRSVLRRIVGEGAGRRIEDPLAANVDRVLLVCSAQTPPFRPGLVDRYLAATALEDLTLGVCVNKVDLGVPDDTAEMLAGYERLGIEVFRTSAATGEGIEALARGLAGQTTLFTGHSGVGKSSLLNAIEPGLALRTGEVTQATAGLGKGTHTTTAARLIPLSMPDTFVVDSPGIRAFGLGQLTPDELLLAFPEIAEAAAGCQVRRCRHEGEPGCAVEPALTATLFGRHRLESYRSLLTAG